VAYATPLPKALCFKENLVAVWQVPVELVPKQWTEEHGSSTEALYDEDGFQGIGHINGLSRVDILADCAARTCRPVEVSIY